MSQPTSRRGFHLLDLAALVVGYSLASLLVRAFWPADGAADPLILSALGLEYLWLGLAMSGPLVLLIRRPGVTEPGQDERSEPRTWAELAWMIIGFYWIGLTMLVVPATLKHTRVIDSAVLGVFPIAAVMALRYFGPRQTWTRLRPSTAGPAWTHRAGIGLLLTWPFAWVGLIVLGQSLL